MAGLVLAVIAGICGLIFLYKQREHPMLGKVWLFIKGMFDGLASIGRLNNPVLFIFYSILIWVMYF